MVAAPATPQSLDCNFDVSLGTFEAIAAMYDGLLGFTLIPDSGVPDARREDIAFHADKVGGVNMYGKLAESLELDPAGKWARVQAARGREEQLGQRADGRGRQVDLVPRLRARRAGRLLHQGLGLSSPDDIKVERQVCRLLQHNEPNPLLLKIHANLYTPVYDSKKCKEAGGTDDPWARKFLENKAPASAPTRCSSWCAASRPCSRPGQDYYGGKPAIDTVVFKEVPTSAARVQLLRGGAVDIAQYLQPLEIISLKTRPQCGGGDGAGVLHGVDRAQRQDRAVRQGRRASRDELRLPAAGSAQGGVTRALPAR